MLSTRQNGETTVIEAIDVLGRKRTVQTLNDMPDMLAFIRGHSNKVTCTAITPVEQPVADRAQSVVTTERVKLEKIIEDKFRVPESREAILAFFKQAGLEEAVPLTSPRHSLKWLRNVFGRNVLRRAFGTRQPT